MNIAYIPFLATALSILGAAVIYGYQKFIDRKTALIELRRKSYRDFLKAYVAMSNNSERIEDITRAFYQSEFDLLIVGSDDVVRAVGALSKFYADTNHDRFKRDLGLTKQLVANVCTAMRNDCFEKTNLNIDDVTALIPIA